MTHSLRTLFGRAAVVASICLVALPACDQDAKTKASATPAAANATTTTGAAAVVAVSDDKACEEYATKFCETTGGDQSPSCQSIRTVSGLMTPEACKAGLSNMDYTKTAFADLGKKCTELMDRLCKDLGEETETCKMVRQTTPNFPAERCGMMLGQYDDVLKELKQQEDRNKPLDEAKQAAIAASDAPSFGPEDAKVTLVEFSDFQCPYCVMAAGVTNQIKQEYGDKVRVVFRQFPLNFHQDAHLAAQASLGRSRAGQVLGVPRPALREPKGAVSRRSRELRQESGPGHEQVQGRPRRRHLQGARRRRPQDGHRCRHGAGHPPP